MNRLLPMLWTGLLLVVLPAQPPAVAAEWAEAALLLSDGTTPTAKPLAKAATNSVAPQASQAVQQCQCTCSNLVPTRRIPITTNPKCGCRVKINNACLTFCVTGTVTMPGTCCPTCVKIQVTWVDCCGKSHQCPPTYAPICPPNNTFSGSPGAPTFGPVIVTITPVKRPPNPDSPDTGTGTVVGKPTKVGVTLGNR